MFVRMLTTRLPGQLVTTSFKYATDSTTKLSACYYLTCGWNNYHHQPRWRSSTACNTTNRLKSYQNYQGFMRSCYSTLPKGNELGKGNIIPNVTVERQHATAEKSLPKDICGAEPVPEKLGLFARFKLMYKQYWYVLIPVHVVTSIGWFAGFYYLSQSGVDIPALLQSIKVSETVIDRLRDSTMGHIAIAYLCYKIATPLRYMVTLGGTTVSIKYLEQYGYIKPMPSKSELMQMYEDKKADRARRKQEREKDDK